MIWMAFCDWRAPGAQAIVFRSPRRSRLATAFVTKTIQGYIESCLFRAHIHWAINVVRSMIAVFCNSVFPLNVYTNLKSTEKILLWFTFMLPTKENSHCLMHTSSPIPNTDQSLSYSTPSHCSSPTLHIKHTFTLRMT